MDGAEVSVLEESNQVCFACFLKGHHSWTLKPEFGHEMRAANWHLCRFSSIVMSNLMVLYCLRLLFKPILALFRIFSSCPHYLGGGGGGKTICLPPTFSLWVTALSHWLFCKNNQGVLRANSRRAECVHFIHVSLCVCLFLQDVVHVIMKIVWIQIQNKCCNCYNDIELIWSDNNVLVIMGVN